MPSSGPVANAPLELALYHGDADFVAKDAVQAYADDVWGNPSTSPFTGHGLYLSVSQPFDFLCTSVRARRYVLRCSHMRGWTLCRHLGITSPHPNTHAACMGRGVVLVVVNAGGCTR